ncbi:MAG: hypothetical protein QM472_08935 [Spirochaetota bacterium]|nr:hypothetical protein [Spirochaetota bacterium]OPZ38914.1 MAG: hypothetical protein BWY96_00697 [Spirochaetes bacterium ADurb.BinA120]HPI13451.1 hypothetical protein [Spirochaetota bacterium]HPV97373.1 hypothetical protein [Spirochaetota bacterium]
MPKRDHNRHGAGKRITAAAFIAGAALCLLCASAEAADLIVRHGDGSINWTRSFISSTGRFEAEVSGTGLPVDPEDGRELGINGARKDTRRRAQEASIESLLSAMKTIRVDPNRRLGDLLQADDTVQRRLSETIAAETRFRRHPSGFVASTCEARLGFGGIIASLPWDYPDMELPVIDNTPLKTDYTGLIVDGRGLKLEPMLFPSIYDENGVEIFGRIFIDSRYALKNGMASYCHTEDEAKALKRAGDRPYYSVALKSLNACPVISEKDARRVLGAQATRNSLKRCRVVIILDKKG